MASHVSHPLRVPLHVSGRAKSNAFLYFKMCARSLVRYLALAERLGKTPHLDPAYDALFDEVEEAAIEPVVFAGMCVEATLYDLAACLFGEEFVEQTERLDPLGKYCVLARLVDREAPDVSGVTCQSLQALVTARNKLVHHKSQAYGEADFTKIMGKAKKEHDQQVAGISASFWALVLLSLHFDGNIFEELRIIPSFKKPEYWLSVVPKELHEEVRWCIQTSRREQRRKQSPPEAL